MALVTQFPKLLCMGNSPGLLVLPLGLEHHIEVVTRYSTIVLRPRWATVVELLVGCQRAIANVGVSCLHTCHTVGGVLCLLVVPSLVVE